jgi:pilus assembly protein CpaC
MTNRLRIGILILFVAIAGATVLYADEANSVNLTVGRSTVLDVGTPITRVSLTSPEVADALVTSPAQLLLHGKTPGTISMFIWDRAGAIKRYDVVVQRDLSRLSSQVLELFPGERISVQGNGKSVIVSGTASSKYVADKAIEVAAGYVEKKEDVVNLVQVQTRGTNQVLLHVRFAEVSRSALTELGATLFTGPDGYKDYVARSTTQQFPSVNYVDRIGPPPPSQPDSQGKMVFSDLLNVFLFNTKYNVGTLIKALQNRGLFQSLAEPNLVAESGKEASFLAGGEIPVPIAQGTGGNVAISVMWKEFGIRLNFTPIVNADRVHLKVRPEVSTLDFNNSVVLQGFRIPALSTRRADTEIELQDRQTFAIAGLMSNSALQSMQKVAGLGDIPILGYLFKSKAAQKDQTELVVMITPEILAPNSPGVTSELPRQIEPFMPPPAANKSFPAPAPAFRSSSSGTADLAPQGSPANATGVAQAPTGFEVPGAVSPASESPSASRPLTKAEKKAAEQAEREDRERLQAELAAQAEQEKRDAKDRERQEKLSREQAKRDAEAEKKAAEVAKRQAEIDRERQKEIDAAAAKLKAAEAAYQAELAKRQQQQ